MGVKVTNKLTSLTVSMTTREVTEFLYNHFPWSGESLDQVENEVVERVAELISEGGVALEGVHVVLNFFKKKFKIDLSTNASSNLIPVVLNKLKVSHYFHATSSSEHEIKGKPNPAVLLSTAKKLNVEPPKCIAFEDSISGNISANGANMKTVVVPPVLEFTDKKYEMSYMKLRRLSEFSDVHLDKIAGNIAMYP